MHENVNHVYADFLANLGIAKFNPMQEEVIAKASSSVNLMLLSPTGSGKTLAYLIAMLNKINAGEKGVQGIVVAPSRELALQIEQVFRSMKTSLRVSCCYGGHSVKIEQATLRDAPSVLIATPGRLADHIDRSSFDTTTVRVVVLDEFDKSLQMGFHEQLKMLFRSLSGKQCHILTSATAMESLPDFLPFRQPDTISYLDNALESKLQLRLVKTKSTEKAETLMKLVAGFNQEVCLIFCNHRETVERISSVFHDYDFEHGIFHGAMEQIDREKNLIRFRGGAHNVLISTDLAARGLDIPEIRHVVHYQLPPREEEFVHRNGRTARMHAEGVAYVILADDEPLPSYISRETKEVNVSPKLKLPLPPQFASLYISLGKKDKISKGDIAGLMMKQGGLPGTDVGLITVLDYASYVSIRRTRADEVIRILKDQKVKKMKFKIGVAS